MKWKGATKSKGPVSDINQFFTNIALSLHLGLICKILISNFEHNLLQRVTFYCSHKNLILNFLSPYTIKLLLLWDLLVLYCSWNKIAIGTAAIVSMIFLIFWNYEVTLLFLISRLHDKSLASNDSSYQSEAAYRLQQNEICDNTKIVQPVTIYQLQQKKVSVIKFSGYIFFNLSSSLVIV